MAQVIVSVCDIHQNERNEERRAIKSIVIGEEGNKPSVLDVCQDCANEKTTILDLLTRVEEHGRPVESGPIPSKNKGGEAPFGAIRCPFGCTPPRGADGFASLQGLKMHMSMQKNAGVHQSYDEWQESQK